MRVAYRGTLDEARAGARGGDLAKRVIEGFRSAFRREPGSDEIATWSQSLPVALDAAATAAHGNCSVLIEYGLPFNDQRIDLLLIGGRNGAPAAHVVELKNWEGRSTELTTCASIYGAQGFELDYAGLFWGTDMVIRNGTWTVGDPKDCYDRAPGARALWTVMRDDPALALQLLRNRYRILLTRGILGTAIYCEDPETREFFHSLVK